MLQRLAVLCTTVFIAVALAACGSESTGALPSAAPPRPAPKVMLIGLDGADLDFIRPHVAAGRLPTFARLLDESAYGELATDTPTKSAIIWTNIATGKGQLEHGITDFVIERPDGKLVPVAENGRLVKALWNIVGERGLRSTTINWWVTWPAEAVAGYMITNYFSRGAEERIVYPPEVLTEIDGYRRINDGELHTEMVLRGLPPLRLKEFPGRGRDAEIYATFLRHYRAERASEKVAYHLLEKDPTDYFAVLFRKIDIVSHFAANFVDPELFAEASRRDLSPERYQSLRHQLDLAFAEATYPVYRYEDDSLARFLEYAGPQTTVIVCSDHGFTYDRRYAFGHYNIEPPPAGIVMIRGPGVRSGAEITGADVWDIAPTVLYLLGLPVAEDMTGTALLDAFTPEHRAAHPLRTIATYESAGGAAGEETVSAPPPIPSEIDQEMVRELEALGYLGGGNESVERSGKTPPGD